LLREPGEHSRKTGAVPAMFVGLRVSKRLDALILFDYIAGSSKGKWFLNSKA
jgi:hypothetical protein